MRRAPAHAGRLRPWERCVFAMVFALMAALVAVATLAAAKSPARELAGRRTAVRTQIALPSLSGSHTDQAAGSSAIQHAANPGTGTAGDATASARLDARLAAALRPVLSGDPGQLSVGVIDLSTSSEALYHASRHFHTASIVKADILATLLYQHQLAGKLLSNRDADLAASMIEDSSDTAATDLWEAVGGHAGLAAADKVLKLGHTIPGSSDWWGLTKTTVSDQLRLLSDLATADSPLDSAGRDYELGLMEDVQADQRWGVPAAATSGSRYPVKDGWLPDPRLWVINSIGIVEHDGQELLIAVLSNHNPTESDGISRVQAAAVAAARAITGPAA